MITWWALTLKPSALPVHKATFFTERSYPLNYGLLGQAWVQTPEQFCQTGEAALPWVCITHSVATIPFKTFQNQLWLCWTLCFSL